MINKELIFLDSLLDKRTDILDEISKKAEKLGLISDKDLYIKAVLDRENEFSTAVGYDVAIPHGKSAAVVDPFVGFLRTRNQIYWDNTTKNPVRLVFLIGVPDEQRETLHLKILAAISKRLLDDEFRNNLLNGNEENVYDLLIDIEKNVR